MKKLIAAVLATTALTAPRLLKKSANSALVCWAAKTLRTV